MTNRMVAGAASVAVVTLGAVGFVMQTRRAEMAKPVLQLDRILQRSDIVVFSKTDCRFCVMAKQLLDKEKLPAFVVEIDRPNLYPDLDMNELIGQMLGRTKCGTVPQIFIKGKFVGGATELGILRDNGDLRKLLSKD